MIVRRSGPCGRWRCLLLALVAAGWLATPAHAAWSSSAIGTGSAQASTLDPPSALAAACGGGIGGLLATQVRLTWAAPARPSLAPVVYEVLRRTTSTGAYTWSDTTTDLSYTTQQLSGSLGGITYYFAVRAKLGDVWLSSPFGPVSRTIGLLGCS